MRVRTVSSGRVPARAQIQRAASTGTPGAPTVPGVKNPLQATIWAKENNVSSAGGTSSVFLEGLSPEMQELLGRLVHVDGKTKLGGVFGWAPFVGGSRVTQDGFDQVVAYHHLDQVQRQLRQLGIDIPAVIAKRHGGTHHPIRAHINKVDDLNAWYSRQSDDLTFGTAKGKWHLGSDADIVIHEAGHLILDHIQPGMGGWTGKEGGAIHEAFGDALAAFYFDDPEMSEDFPVARGRAPDTTKGLRDLKNQLTLTDVGREVHDRSRPYGGFFWSLRQQLADPTGEFQLRGGTSRELMMQLLLTHAFLYKTRSPSPVDFVDAVLDGFAAMDEQGGLPLEYGKFKQAILTEAVKRKFLTPAQAQQRLVAHRRTLHGFVPDLQAAMRQFGPEVAFKEDTRLRHIGGQTVHYQQVFNSTQFGELTMIGQGMSMFFTRNGYPMEISTRDARTVAPGTIDETVRINLRTAVNTALREARVRESKSTVSLRQQAAADPAVRAPLEMEQRIARTSRQRLEQLRKTIGRIHFTGTTPDVEFVVLPGRDGLHYQLKLGLELGYVDARTGDIAFHKDVFVN
jgi:hypothetical protein